MIQNGFSFTREKDLELRVAATGAIDPEKRVKQLCMKVLVN